MADADSRQSSVDAELAAHPRLPHGGPLRGRCLNVTTGEWTSDPCSPPTSSGSRAAQPDIRVVKTHRSNLSGSPIAMNSSPPEESRNERTHAFLQDTEGKGRQPTQPSSTIKRGRIASRGNIEDPDNCDPSTFHQYDCGTPAQDEQDSKNGVDNEGLAYCDPMTFHQFDCDDSRDKQLQSQIEPEEDHGGFYQSDPPSSTMEKEQLASRADRRDTDYCDPLTFECGYPPESLSEKEEGLGPIEKKVLVPRDFVA